MKNNNFKTILLVALLIAAMGGGIILLGQNQETRRGAYFAGATMSISPENVTINGSAVKGFQLFVNTQDNAKLSGMETTVCYGDELTIDAKADSTLDHKVVANTDSKMKIFDISTLPAPAVVGTDHCFKLVMTSADGVAPNDLKSGTIQVATLRFKPVKNGDGVIKISKEDTILGGASGTSDTAISVGEVKNATYKVENVDGDDDDDDDDDGGTGDNAQVNFKMAFGGVKKEAKCAENWAIDMIVLGNGVSKVYTDITPEEIDTTNDLKAFGVSKELEGFNKTQKVAVFVSGPKHLQSKYAKQDQSEFYNLPSGELTLKKVGESGQPVYNFTKYPLFAGDVTDGSGGGPDGVINSADFKAVQDAAKSHATVAEGSYLPLDLDGNCQMNSNDVAILKESLKEKQSQLY